MEFIPVANVKTEEEDGRAVYDVVKSGWLSKGKKVDEFESQFVHSVGARHAIAVNSGTAALHSVLAALGIGPGDEVILPSLTFISTANVVLYQGATPVLVECAPERDDILQGHHRRKPDLVRQPKPCKPGDRLSGRGRPQKERETKTQAGDPCGQPDRPPQRVCRDRDRPKGNQGIRRAPA